MRMSIESSLINTKPFPSRLVTKVTFGSDIVKIFMNARTIGIGLIDKYQNFHLSTSLTETGYRFLQKTMKQRNLWGSFTEMMSYKWSTSVKWSRPKTSSEVLLVCMIWSCSQLPSCLVNISTSWQRLNGSRICIDSKKSQKMSTVKKMSFNMTLHLKAGRAKIEQNPSKIRSLRRNWKVMSFPGQKLITKEGGRYRWLLQVMALNCQVLQNPLNNKVKKARIWKSMFSWKNKVKEQMERFLI